MAEATASTWKHLIREKRDAFGSRRCQLPPHINSERSFRSEFESLCRLHIEFNYPRLLGKLSFASINAFAKAVDAIFQHDPPFTLGDLVSGGCFAVIERGCQADLRVSEVTEIVGDLNGAVPWLAHDVSRYPNNPDVQAPLQEMLDTYMDTLLFILDCFSGEGPSPSSDPREVIGARIRDVTATFQTQNNRYGEMLDRAQRNETRAMSNGSWNFVGSAPDDPQRFHGSQPRFVPQRMLGRGSYGEVHEVHESSTGNVYARKMIYLGNRSSEAAAALEREVRQECETMNRLPHPHIVKVLFSQKEHDRFNIFMHPVADQDLRAYLEACVQDRYPEASLQSTFQWFGCLLQALAFAHRRNVIHYDIKLSNILVKLEGERRVIYLADFGMAKDFSERSASMTASYNVRGTPLYRAPEVKPGSSRGRMADIFSLGCVFSEMLTVCCQRSLEDYQEFRRAPYDEHPLAFRANLPKVQLWLQQLEESHDGEPFETMVHLIGKMVKDDPERRRTAPSAVKLLEGTGKARSLFCSDCLSEE